MENGYIESFNGKLRDELLNGEILEAKVLSERWRVKYDTIRQHAAVGYQPRLRRRGRGLIRPSRDLRMTHIMWLVNLAPDLQEAIRVLPRVESGPEPSKEIDVRRIAQVLDWRAQRKRWGQLADLAPI